MDHWKPWVQPSESLVWPVRLDPAGVRGPTRGQARGPRWRACARGWYVPADTDSPAVEQRILEQAVRASAAEYGAVTGWAALRWRGAAYFDGLAPDGSSRPVPLLTPVGGKPSRQGAAHLSACQHAPTEIEMVRGLRCATVQRALFDEVRFAPSAREGAVSASMAAAAGLISIALFSEYVAHRCAWEGVPLTRAALPLATDECRSPQECRMMHVWCLDAGLPRPLLNRPVFDLQGKLLGYPDLLDVDAGLVGEYDGFHHKEGVQHGKDVAREGRFRDVGLEYFAVVGGDLRDRRLVVRRMLSARSRARFLPPGQRLWTTDPPPWWDVPDSLDARLRRLGRAPALTHR